MKRFANATGATAFAAVALLCAAAHAGMGSSSYVQSGLVAHWDAIDNIGPNGHSIFTNRWHSLVNPEHAFEVRVNATWARDALQFANGNEVFLDGVKSAATFGQTCTNGTLEFCFTRQSNGGAQTLLRSIYDLSLTQCGSGAIALRNDSNAPVFSFKAGRQTLAAVYGEAHTDVTRYIDGLLDTASSEQNYVGGGASGGTWLGRRDTGT